MVQKDVSLNCVMAWVGWALAIVCSVLDVLGVIGPLAGLVVLFAGAAAVLHVRGFVHGLERREVRAYELGRDHERLIRSVR